MFKSRLVWLLSGIAAAVGMVALAQVPISGLPNAGTQTGNEYVPEVQSGTTVKTTTAALAAFAATAANPTGEVCSSAVDGVATTFMRSDAAPPLNETCNYTLTGDLALTQPLQISLSAAGNAIEFTNGTYTSSIFLGVTYGFQAGTTSNSPTVLYANSVNGLIIQPENGTYSQAEVYDAEGNAQNAGYLGTPPNSQSSNYTLALSDRGKTIEYEAASGTISVPCSGLFASGDVVTIANVSGSSGDTITITASSGTLYWSNGTVTSGNRTLTTIGIATIYFNGTPGSTSVNCLITGSGIS